MTMPMTTSMHITFSPLRADTPLALERRGDILIMNAVSCDLSRVLDGESCAPEVLGCAWLAGPVTRTGGVLHVPVYLPHGPNAPEQTLFPAPVKSTQDGIIDTPPHDAPHDAPHQTDADDLM